MGHADVGPIS